MTRIKNVILLVRYCGTDTPPTIRAKEIEIIFHTDATGRSDGFNASYTFLAAGTLKLDLNQWRIQDF